MPALMPVEGLIRLRRAAAGWACQGDGSQSRTFPHPHALALSSPAPQGFPTLLFFPAGKAQEAIPYTDERTLKVEGQRRRGPGDQGGLPGGPGPGAPAWEPERGPAGT